METRKEQATHPPGHQYHCHQRKQRYLLHVKNLQQHQEMCLRHQRKQQEEILQSNDKPMDLTNGSSSSFTKETKKEPQPSTSATVTRLKQEESAVSSNTPSSCLINEPSINYLRNVENQTEVLKAAKSLFSKKTRTLYHWMYPNTPKFQLKSAVSLAWDNMGLQEKQFYISQVVGKLGYLQTSLMVNPQLGSMSLPLPTLPPANSSSTSSSHHRLQQSHSGNPEARETRNAVSNLLKGSNASWQHEMRKRGRPRSLKAAERIYKYRKGGKFVRGGEVEDFTDDPELRKELEQFQWALHFVEK